MSTQYLERVSAQQKKASLSLCLLEEQHFSARRSLGTADTHTNTHTLTLKHTLLLCLKISTQWALEGQEKEEREGKGRET